MIRALRAEFRKLLTVRTTYGITIFVVLFVSIIGFYFEGWRLSPAALHDPMQFTGDVTGALNLAVMAAVVAVLLMTSEYRYNTIMYTLTSSNSRSKVLLSKIIVVSVYAVFLGVLIGVLSPGMSYLGALAHGHSFVPQTLHISNLAWRSLFYAWGFGMAGLLLATLTRNQIFSIVALFLIPDVVEQTLGFLLLKHNTVYLPFAALSHVINGNDMSTVTGSNLSAAKAAAVYCTYLVVGWFVAWILFLRRDAN